MAFLSINDETAIYYEHKAPSGHHPTIVFFNSMSANTRVWEDGVAPGMRAAGFGTLTFDYRGQKQTRYGPSATLTPREIVADAVRLLAAVAPVRPVFVGLSIGGLFAMQAHLEGAKAIGLALINTLRKPGPMVDWIIELEGRLIALGGMPLLMDVLRPMLAGKEELARLRPDSLPEGGYAPWPPDNPRYRLGEGVREADWDVPYEALDAPVLVLTGMHDRLFRIQPDVDELVARIRDVEVVTFDDAGHALHDERPERFLDVVTAFADRCAATGRAAATRGAGAASNA